MNHWNFYIWICKNFKKTSVQKYFQLGCFINYQMYIVFAAVNSLFCFSCFVIKNFDLLCVLSASKPTSAELYQEVFAGEHLTLINHLSISLWNSPPCHVPVLSPKPLWNTPFPFEKEALHSSIVYPHPCYNEAFSLIDASPLGLDGFTSAKFSQLNFYF